MKTPLQLLQENITSSSVDDAYSVYWKTVHGLRAQQDIFSIEANLIIPEQFSGPDVQSIIAEYSSHLNGANVRSVQEVTDDEEDTQEFVYFGSGNRFVLIYLIISGATLEIYISSDDQGICEVTESLVKK